VRLQNFRCYRDEIAIALDDLTVLTGRNDSGKSTVLDALAIFFDEAKLDVDDGCLRGDRSCVTITCEFGDLPESLVLDATCPTSLADEYLLNEDGLLEIRKVYDASRAATP